MRPRLAFDATFAVGQYRGMGRYVRQLADAWGDEVAWLEPGGTPHPLWEQVGLAGAARRAGADLLVCGYNTGPVFAGPPPRLLVIHDLIFHQPLRAQWREASSRQLLGALVRRLVCRPAAARARAVLTVSHATRRQIRDTFGLPEESITVIPNTLPAFWFDAVAARAPGHDLSRHEYLFCVSGSAPSKNLRALLSAYAADAGRSLPPRLAVAGLKPEEAAAFRTLAAGLGIGGQVVFLPRIDDEELRALYDGAAAFVFPSRAEGFGIPLLEAMARGAPIACSDIPVFREIGQDAARYFDPNDSAAMVAAMAAAVSRGPVTAHAARQRARDFGAEAWRERTRGFLERVAGGRQSGGTV